MGWTGKLNHRRTRLRHRPQLEYLDDRCLLSSGTGIRLIDHSSLPAGGRPDALVRHTHEATRHTFSLARTGRQDARLHRELERPAGTIETGAATAYDPVIGAALTRSTYGVDGTGMTVAVIDTGVDYQNAALGAGFGPGAKVVAGYDFADDSTNPMAVYSQHGTAIAGLIGSDDPNDLGVAPGVKIVALRVTDSSNTASLSSVASALEWVIANHATYNITAVNMSLSDGGNYAQNWFANDGGAGQEVTNLIGQLTSMNIPVIAATGNSFSGVQGEGFAAIVAGTISVTATDLSGNLLANAQRLGSAIGGASATTIAAPGQGLTAPSGDSGTATVDGTSFAAALVTGGVTLLQDIYESRFGTLPTVAQIKDWIQQGSNPITDPVTGIALGELDIPKAAALIPEPAPTQPVTANPPVNVPLPVSVISPAAPTVVPPQSTTTAAALPTTTVTSTASVQVFLNGQEIGAGGSTSASASGSLDQTTFERLLEAMSVWAASPTSPSQGSATQVQIWNA